MLTLNSGLVAARVSITGDGDPVGRALVVEAHVDLGVRVNFVEFAGLRVGNEFERERRSLAGWCHCSTDVAKGTAREGDNGRRSKVCVRQSGEVELQTT